MANRKLAVLHAKITPLEHFAINNKGHNQREMKTISMFADCSDAVADLLHRAEQRVQLRLNRVPPHYAQLPDGLILDKRVSPDAKLVYALLHKHAPIKNLNKLPVVHIAQQTLADEMGRTEETIRSLLRELISQGWVSKHRQGKMKPNRYVLYPRSRLSFQAYVAMEKVQIRIQRDQALAKRLRESLYPQSDHKDSCGHARSGSGKVTTSARGAY